MASKWGLELLLIEITLNDPAPSRVVFNSWSSAAEFMIRKFIGWAICGLAFFWQPLAQPQKSPVLDVASVKPHPGASPGTMMRESPGSVNYIGIPLMKIGR